MQFLYNLNILIGHMPRTEPNHNPSILKYTNTRYSKSFLERHIIFLQGLRLRQAEHSLLPFEYSAIEFSSIDVLISGHHRGDPRGMRHSPSTRRADLPSSAAEQGSHPRHLFSEGEGKLGLERKVDLFVVLEGLEVGLWDWLCEEVTKGGLHSAVGHWKALEDGSAGLGGGFAVLVDEVEEVVEAGPVLLLILQHPSQHLRHPGLLVAGRNLQDELVDLLKILGGIEGCAFDLSHGSDLQDGHAEGVDVGFGN
jgi:hypothetical protein